MMAFAAHVPANIPRIALVDFNNDSVTDSLRTMQVMFEKYAALKEAGETEAEKYILYAVRLDTSGNMRDENVPPLGDPGLDLGVTPRLVFSVRQSLDNAWENWDLPEERVEMARNYCQSVRIVATGGFNPDKIGRFEKLNVPVDIYGVGSSLIRNDAVTNTDFTADIVRVKIDGEWHDMAKIGRGACNNPGFEPVDLAGL